jgi:hypothetical protein
MVILGAGQPVCLRPLPGTATLTSDSNHGDNILL